MTLLLWLGVGLVVLVIGGVLTMFAISGYVTEDAGD